MHCAEMYTASPLNTVLSALLCAHSFLKQIPAWSDWAVALLLQKQGGSAEQVLLPASRAWYWRLWRPASELTCSHALPDAILMHCWYLVWHALMFLPPAKSASWTCRAAVCYKQIQAVSIAVVHAGLTRRGPVLQLIPGMTKNGKQKTPDWINKFLGVKEENIPKDVPRPAGFPDINGKPTT